MTHSYTSTESWTYTGSNFKPILTYAMVWVLGWCGGNSSLFTGFKVVIYWGLIKISTGLMISKKERIKWQRGGPVFLFHQSKLRSLEMPRTKLVSALLF